ncbi:MAG: cytochrome c, partial [Candidatus Methylomirabilota bacterium]
GRRSLVRHLAAWTLAGAALTGLGFLWWQGRIPAEAGALVFPAEALLRPTFFLGVGALMLLALLTAGVGCLAPRGFGMAAALLAVLLAGSVFGSYERIREGARKPFVIAGYMYSNGIRVDEVQRLDRDGLLTKARWAGLGVAPGPRAMGEAVYRAQCLMCHSLDGYLAITRYVEGQDAEGLTAFLEALRPGRPGMPPIVGTEAELTALAGYLAVVAGEAAGSAAAPRGGAQ